MAPLDRKKKPAWRNGEGIEWIPCFTTISGYISNSMILHNLSYEIFTWAGHINLFNFQEDSSFYLDNSSRNCLLIQVTTRLKFWVVRLKKSQHIYRGTDPANQLIIYSQTQTQSQENAFHHNIAFAHRGFLSTNSKPLLTSPVPEGEYWQSSKGGIFCLLLHRN